MHHWGGPLPSGDRQVDVYEGEFTASAFNPIAVLIPPLETAPDATVFRKDGKTSGHSANISQVTPNIIRFSVITTEAFGIYGFRARGKILSREPAEAAPSP